MKIVQEPKSMDETRQKLISIYQRTWWETDIRAPKLGKTHTPAQQKQKEKETDQLIKEMRSSIQRYPGSEKDRILWEHQLREKAGIYCKNTLEFSDAQIAILFQKGFTDSTLRFFREVKAFDSEFKLEDTFQAIRNVWIMNSIQVFLGMEPAYTPSVFAYSMLYPYTDNYLDDPGVSRENKKRISSRFEKRLAGQDIDPENAYELALFMLVHKIERQYPRAEYPQVYESLLGIHSAQIRSLKQQDRISSPYEADILAISIEKGGMSVLADAFLTKGTLTEEEAAFMFGFGVILQLADDLQDVSTDLKNGHMTIFSQTAGQWKLDALADRLFGFISRLMEADPCFSSSQAVSLKSLIQYNCKFLMLQAIAKHPEYFSKRYLQRVEPHSPFSFSYLRRLNRRLEKEYRSLRRKKDPILQAI